MTTNTDNHIEALTNDLDHTRAFLREERLVGAINSAKVQAAIEASGKPGATLDSVMKVLAWATGQPEPLCQCQSATCMHIGYRMEFAEPVYEDFDHRGMAHKTTYRLVCPICGSTGPEDIDL